MSKWTLLYSIIVGLASMTLAGCPVPLLSGDTSGTRLNIGETVPEFVVVGKTSRADVLLALGEPDGASENSEQITYTGVKSKGGLMFVMAAGSSAGAGRVERMAYRRLIVTFDDAGVVTSARLEHASCTERSLLLNQEVGGTPCVDVAGRDVFPGAPVGISQSGIEPYGRVFVGALWHQGVRGFDQVRALLDQPADIDGSLVVADSTVSFIPPNADRKAMPLLRFAYTDISEVYVDKFGLNRRVVIKRRNGAFDSFSIKGGIFVDSNSTEIAGELVVSRWKAVAATQQ